MEHDDELGCGIPQLSIYFVEHCRHLSEKTDPELAVRKIQDILNLKLWNENEGVLVLAWVRTTLATACARADDFDGFERETLEVERFIAGYDEEKRGWPDQANAIRERLKELKRVLDELRVEFDEWAAEEEEEDVSKAKVKGDKHE